MIANGDDFQQSKSILRFRLGILVLSSLLLAGYFWYQGASVGMHVDEYTTWLMGRLSWGEFWQNRSENGHMPLWFALSVILRPLTGETEIGMRLPAGILFGMTVLILWLLTKAGLSRRTTTLAMAFVALNQVALWAGLNARPSILLQLGGALMLVGGEVLRYRGGKWPLVAVATGSVLGMGAGAAFAGTALFYGLYVWLARAMRSVRKPLLITVVAGPLLWLPVLGYVAVNQKKYETPKTFQRTLNPERYISPLGEVVLGENARGMRLALALVFVAAMATGARRHPVGAAGAAIFGGTWLTLTVAQLMTGHSVLGHGRYFSPGLVGGLVAFAIGLESWGRSLRRLTVPYPRFLRGIVSLVCLALPVAMLGMAAYNSSDYTKKKGDGVREMVQALMKRPEEIMVLPDGAPFRYEFLKQGGESRYKNAVLTPRGLDAQTSATVHARIENLWKGDRIFYLVVYNNKRDPLDGVLAEPPKGWTKSEEMKFGDTRVALMFPAEIPLNEEMAEIIRNHKKSTVK